MRLWILFAVVASSLPVRAQERQGEVFRSDMGFGLAWAPGFQMYGLGLISENKWNVTDQAVAGLRLEGNIMGGGAISGGSDSNVTLRIGIHVAILAEAEYYFTAPETGFRPYLGLAGGMFVITGQALRTSNVGASQYAGRYFGAAPQLGIDFGGFRLGLTYNYIFGGDAAVFQSVGDPARHSRNHLSLDFTFVGYRWSPPRG